jgi:hypothetical protein
VTGPAISGGDCLGCHGAAASDGANTDIGNDGVRVITTEFTRTSHHAYGRTLTKLICATCHGEGDSSGNTTALHKNGQIDLRNADNASSYYVWTGTEYANVDLHCMSCHDSTGASATAFSAGATATKPFGAGTVTNAYDTIDRTAVVDVKSQFNIAQGVGSHHAVINRRYSTGGTQYLKNGGGLTGTGLEGTMTDSSLLHCGDCHTVGQWQTAGGVGAHGSTNEYLLKTTGGDVEHTSTTYVCLNCHPAARYADNTTHAPGNGSDYVHTSASTGTARASGSGDIVGMTCANCHNAGATGWGGIHGGNKSYTSGAEGAQTTYRFLPGMGNTGYNPSGWTTGTAGLCYTNPTANWGSCTKHSTASGKQAGSRIARPLSY